MSSISPKSLRQESASLRLSDSKRMLVAIEEFRHSTYRIVPLFLTFVTPSLKCSGKECFRTRVRWALSSPFLRSFWRVPPDDGLRARILFILLIGTSPLLAWYTRPASSRHWKNLHFIRSLDPQNLRVCGTATTTQSELWESFLSTRRALPKVFVAFFFYLGLVYLAVW